MIELERLGNQGVLICRQTAVALWASWFPRPNLANIRQRLFGENMRRTGITKELRQAVLDRDGHRCRYCGTNRGPFHMDHVYPISKGGETTIRNLVTACSICNIKKNNKVGQWPVPIGTEKEKDWSLLFVCLLWMQVCFFVIVACMMQLTFVPAIPLRWIALSFALIGAFVAALAMRQT